MKYCHVYYSKKFKETLKKYFSCNYKTSPQKVDDIVLAAVGSFRSQKVTHTALW